LAEAAWRRQLGGGAAAAARRRRQYGGSAQQDDGGSLAATACSLAATACTSQHAKVDLKLLIVSVIPIFSFSDTIHLFCFLFFILINKLITFNAS
jgi:hypothetical protein